MSYLSLNNKNQNFYFFAFLNKERSKFISSTFERKRLKEKFTHLHITTSQYHNFLRMLFTFQRINSSSSSAFKEIIGDIFPLHRHILICYGSGFRPCDKQISNNKMIIWWFLTLHYIISKQIYKALLFS